MTGPNFSAIRVRLRYESIEDFMQGYLRFISKGGMFIPMSPAKLKPVGTTIRFQFLLQDGTTALLGEGVVRQIQGANSGDDSSVGILVKFTRLNRQSKELVERILELKRQTRGPAGDLDVTPTPPAFALGAQASADSPDDALDPPEPAAEDEALDDLFLSPKDAVDGEDASSLDASGSDVFSDAHALSQASETSEASDASSTPTPGSDPQPISPQHLGSTEAGLQILAFDRVSDDEAAGLANFDFDTDEGDIDQMFDGVFGDGALFGAAEDPAPDAPAEEDLFGGGDIASPPAQHAQPSLIGATANDGGEAFDLHEEVGADEALSASGEFQLDALEDDDFAGEDFEFNIDDSDAADESAIEEDASSDEAYVLQDEHVLQEDDAVFEEADIVDEDVEPDVRSDDFAPEFNPAPSDDLISVLDALDSDEELPQRGLTLGSAAQLAAVRDDEEEEEDSLAALLALAQQDIEAKREADGEAADADAEGDIFDQLLGVDDLPPPPKNEPLFDITDSEPKKKGGFISKLFGKD